MNGGNCGDVDNAIIGNCFGDELIKLNGNCVGGELLCVIGNFVYDDPLKS